MTSASAASLHRTLSSAGIPCDPSVLLRDYTTFRIGGAATLLCRPQTEKQMTVALDIWRAYDGCPLFILGKGSNVLFSDAGFPGLVICTRDLQDVSLSETHGNTVTIRTGCGVPLPSLSRRCASESPSLSGLEFACGIPGTVGGAVAMNAGAHGKEMSDIVCESLCVDRTDGRLITLRGQDHAFSYRQSIYGQHPEWVLLHASLSLTPADSSGVKSAMEQYLTARRRSQPLEYPSAGSVFRRPPVPDMYVGRMVEECGLKGFRIGDAEISEKHAGFIVNRGKATADDVRRLIAHIHKAVLLSFGIDLECEICVIRSDGRREEGKH